MSTHAAEQTAAARFAELAARWRADAGPLSGPAEIAGHPAYREIAAMGEPAIRLILAELEARPGHWSEALKALTGEDPVPPEAWLEWGRREEADRAEAIRITPSDERLRAMMARRPVSTIDYDHEEMPY